MKKTYSQLIVCVLIALGFAMAVAGQEVTITKAEFNKIETAGYKGLGGKTYRSTTVVETLVDGVSDPEKEYRRIYESLPPDRSRDIFVIKQNGKGETSESLEIGPRSWTRTNGGPWVRDKETRSLASAAGVASSLFESYKLIGNSKLAGVSVIEYESVDKWSRTAYNDSSKLVTEIITTRIWVDKDGLMRKQEREIENIDTNEVNRTTTVYEYNVNIKIEAPMK